MDIWHPENLTEEDLPNLPLDEMSETELRQALERIQEIYAEIEDEEPLPGDYPDPEDDEAEYEEWEDRLEALDDLMDDIQDRLDDIEKTND